MTPPLALLLHRWRPDPAPGFPGRYVIPPGLRAFAAAGMASLLDKPLFAVVPGERDAEELADDAALFTSRVVLVPAWETLPFEHISPNAETMARRAKARHLLRAGAAGTLVVASVRAAVQRLAPSPVEPLVVDRGSDLDRDAFIGNLAEYGYERTHRVEARAEFAVRGGVIDVYPAQGGPPVRIDMWGDVVEDLRHFATADQRSTDACDRCEAFPAREFRPGGAVVDGARRLLEEQPWASASWDRLAHGVSFPGMESWMPWLAPAVTLFSEAAGASAVVFDPQRARQRSEELIDEERSIAEALTPTWGERAPAAGDFPTLYLPLTPPAAVLEAPGSAGGPGDAGIAARGLDAKPGDPRSVATALAALRERGVQPVVAMDGDPAADRVARLLGEVGFHAGRPNRLEESGPAVLGVGIHRGFIAPDLAVAVLGEREIAGRRRAHRRPRPGRMSGGDPYHDLVPGSYVVHRHHGIGRFEGLVTRTISAVERDYLLIAYAGEDRLYVPTDQLAAVRPYSGGESPRLSRMGGSDWEQTRGRVRRALAVVAERVVALHRARAGATGYAFPPDTPWQAEMEAAFAFEETPDQLEAIIDTKRDMESPRPMDRLIFGDVGFGKTEVALRAAFKCVQEDRQSAVLVPTTLLAQQHHQTFRQRMDPYPVRVEMLSRFLSPREQAEVVGGLGEGTVDIVIGTHRLLSNDVAFADLGLLIVDEEQRFGVAAKDRIKELRASIDVLTLTATPIPRTLEMALTGVRDVSHIRTAPEDRHPILTYVGPFDEQAAAAAIRRELLREGQVFWVHNRIQSIDHAVARLRNLVPDASYAVAHGRMSEGELEQVMLDFWNGEHDVLVATTIIESGLDLPQVNTLIVERADRLGLAQLYQLRGRVGRSSQRAYAYLFHPTDQVLAEDAYRRLEAIAEHGDLGSGFDLAMRDLQIRGAGSILGEVQSGQIAAVGVDLYAELVAEAVSELRGAPPPRPPLPEIRIDLNVDAHLPDGYVVEQAARLEAYRRLAAAAGQAEVDEVVAEWRDRYGELPLAAENLAAVARLRVEALRVGISEIVQLRNEVRLGPVSLAASQEVRLERLAPAAVLRPSEGLMFLPVPEGDVAAGLLAFMGEMWPSRSQVVHRA